MQSLFISAAAGKKYPPASLRRDLACNGVNRQLAGIGPCYASAPLALRHRFSAVLPFIFLLIYYVILRCKSQIIFISATNFPCHYFAVFLENCCAIMDSEDFGLPFAGVIC